MRRAVTICMPTFNESVNIVEYLRQLEFHFRGSRVNVLVVDDCSTDDTVAKIREANFGDFVTILTNTKNRGHGPTVISGLSTASLSASEVIVTVDGDGDISAVEIQKLLARLDSEDADLVEGCRRERSDPTFRKVVSLGTRCLITLVGGFEMWSAKDANTPARAYKREILVEILKHLLVDSMTPNLLISMVARQLDMRVRCVDVSCRHIDGRGVQGTTWRARFRSVPSRRFLKFCWCATFDVLRFGVGLRKLKVTQSW